MTPTTIDLPVSTDSNGHVIELGSLVKSYDFPHRVGTDRDVEDCQVEGVVEGCAQMGECEHYVIRVTRRFWNGAVVDPEREYIYPPLNGVQTTFGGVTHGVLVIDSPQPATADEALRAAVEALTVVAMKGGKLTLEDWEQVNRALALAESHQADMDAHLDTMDRADADLYGCRERDNMVGL